MWKGCRVVIATTTTKLQEELRLVDDVLGQIESRRADARDRLDGLSARRHAMSVGERLVGGVTFEREVSAVVAELHRLHAAASLTTEFLRLRDRQLRDLDKTLH
jgi:hypothetical protein